MTPLVGLAGLGNMGRAVAARLGAAGIGVLATSRSAETRQAAARTGIDTVDTPAQVTAALAARVPAGPLVVLTSVPDGAALRQVVLGPDGLLAGLPQERRAIVVDLSTTAPQDATALAEELRAAGHGVLDAPVSGGPGGARDGTLSIMAGGADADLAQVRPVLDPLGTVVHCGPVGSGQVVKACNQLLVAAGLVAVAEALTLARRHGVDPALARAALLRGFAGSRVLELQGERMLRRDFDTRGSVALLAKDVDIVTRLAGEVGLGVPVTTAADQVVRSLAALDADIDHSAVITVIEKGLCA